MSEGEPRGFLAEEARELVAGTEGGRAAVIDLRGEDDFSEGHIPSATRIEEPTQGDLEEVSRGGAEVEVVLLVCDDGERSGECARELACEGREVGWLEGGMSAWPGPVQPRPDIEFEGPRKQTLY